MFKEIIVSPPFGNYIASSRVTSVLGSYTLKARHGRLLKVCQFALDNLRYPVWGGYRNRIGLRNKGVGSIGGLFEECIYSLVGLEPYDWETLYYFMLECPKWGNFDKPTIELNVSCPNVDDYQISREVLEKFCSDFRVILKVPPDLEKIRPLVDMFAECGGGWVHCSNTLPSDIGGLSGYPLKRVNLSIVEEISKILPVIGGGGIYEWQDILDYSSAGAICFSTSTIWLNPLKAWKLINRFYKDKDVGYETSNQP